MRIIFEEHQYKASKVKDDLKDISALQDVDKKISVSYVGYFYNATVKDCVFILPKVLLSDKKLDDGNTIEVVANVTSKDPEKEYITPEDIITPEGQQKYLPKEYRKFIYEFAVWIYRALSVYRNNNKKSKAIYFRQLPQEGRGKRHKADTYLDIILSLIRFNRENQDFFMFIIKNLHSGHNKINWTKTISKTQGVIQDDSVVYMNPVNKKRVINFEEELFIIFFSILNYINDTYGFNSPINWQYDLITGKRFKSYINGRGRIRLLQIKYKYFSDKALQLWDLCYAFFDAAHKLTINTTQKEYLLAKNFEHVFEAMIDDLIGSTAPRGLKEQRDGKRVDHIYTSKGLTISDEQDEEVYYIGDSKYYKIGHKLGRESIYKQYTYARNVIQWNIELFMDGERKDWSEEDWDDYLYDKGKFGKIHLRDDGQDPLTEGYNVIPNFFISAFVDEKRCYISSEAIKKNNANETHISWQFSDRLFDRDTLILSHYDVNFLYVLYLYARNKHGEKKAWRDEVRNTFREEIRGVLQKRYDFYALKSKGNPLAGEQFIRDHFKELQGKLYRPFIDKDIYTLALEKPETGSTQEHEAYILLSEFFIIEKINLGKNPKEELNTKIANYQATHPYNPVPENWLPEYHVERYFADHFVIGMYHDQEHWDWITGKNDRGSQIYNVRLGKSRDGAMSESRIRAMKPKFAILYQAGQEAENKYHVFRIHDMAKMNEERMRQAQYPSNHGGPSGDYLIFRFDEEVSIGHFDINALIARYRLDHPEYIYGSPIYPTGEELLKYKS